MLILYKIVLYLSGKCRENILDKLIIYNGKQVLHTFN